MKITINLKEPVLDPKESGFTRIIKREQASKSYFESGAFVIEESDGTYDYVTAIVPQHNLLAVFFEYDLAPEFSSPTQQSDDVSLQETPNKNLLSPSEWKLRADKLKANREPAPGPVDDN